MAGIGYLYGRRRALASGCSDSAPAIASDAFISPVFTTYAARHTFVSHTPGAAQTSSTTQNTYGIHVTAHLPPRAPSVSSQRAGAARVRAVGGDARGCSPSRSVAGLGAAFQDSSGAHGNGIVKRGCSVVTRRCHAVGGDAVRGNITGVVQPHHAAQLPGQRTAQHVQRHRSHAVGVNVSAGDAFVNY